MIQFAPEPSGRAGFDAFCRRLLLANWQNPQGPLHLNPNLAPAALASAGFFQNTRVFLTALAQSNGTAATATGNLNRLFVGQMFERFSLPERLRQSTLLVCKVLNEPDLWPLHLVRLVSQCAGLVSRRGKRFQLTRLGRDLLPEAQAGALFLKLFVAYFRKFDLQYGCQLRAVPGLQETLTVILWRLDTLARDWVPVHGLAPQLLLPGVLTQLRQTMVSAYDTEEWILIGYVLGPLFGLGLLERRETSQWPGLKLEDHIRVTALWRQFISFN